MVRKYSPALRIIFLSNAEVLCGQAPTIANATHGSVGNLSYGNSVTYTCAKGFEMTGSATIFCQADGTWTQKPICSGMSFAIYDFTMLLSNEIYRIKANIQDIYFSISAFDKLCLAVCKK